MVVLRGTGAFHRDPCGGDCEEKGMNEKCLMGYKEKDEVAFFFIY